MGCLVDRIDALIDECVEAGVVFRPRRGQLRPLLTAGRPPDDLLRRVKADREGILLRLAEMVDFDDFDAETETEAESDSKR
jgi:hypothetical protein